MNTMSEFGFNGMNGIAENVLKNGGVKQSVWRNGFHAMDVISGFATSVQILTLGAHHQAGGIAKCVCEQVSVVSACCKRNGIVSQAQCMCIHVCVDAYLALVAFCI